MASSYSPLKIELIGTGEQSGTWGATTNANLEFALSEAITGSADVSFSSADVTVTLTNTNAAQTARNLRLNLTGTSGGARELILGSGCQIEKLYLINNTLSDAVTVKNTTGTGIAVPAGKSMFVFNNGTNVVDAVTHLSSLTLGAALPVASGGTGLATLTANNVLIGNGTGNVAFIAPGTNGNVLTSNGTTWTSAAAPASAFASGTVLLFYQAAAPTGWTQVTTQNDKALRVVSGTGGGAAGTTAFTTVFANQTPTITTSGLSAAATTLSTSQIPSHSHTTTAAGNTWGGSGCGGSGIQTDQPVGGATDTLTGTAGTGGSHTHSLTGSATSSAITLNVQYIDIILCSKN